MIISGEGAEKNNYTNKTQKNGWIRSLLTGNEAKIPDTKDRRSEEHFGDRF